MIKFKSSDQQEIPVFILTYKMSQPNNLLQLEQDMIKKQLFNDLIEVKEMRYETP
jgi:hypothetical protein